MKNQKEIRQAGFFTLLTLLLVIAVGAAALHRAKETQKIIYVEHLDERAVTIDGKERRFRDLAFYLAYQEMTIEEQARAYDLKQAGKYWNMHANGIFIRVEARDMAVKMAVHDEIFYRMALERQIELSQEETDYMENRKADFWSDLEEDGQARLGVSLEEISEVFERMALAQKMQQVFADEKGVDCREYNVNGELYEELLQEHTYEINEKLWKRLNFGKIILD